MANLHETIHTSPIEPPRGASRPRMRVWDAIVTGVLLAAAVLIVPGVWVLSVFSIGALDSCGYVDCNEDLLLRAWALVLVAPAAIVLAAGIIAVVRLRSRRLAFWVPLLALVGIGACVQAAQALLLLAVPA